MSYEKAAPYYDLFGAKDDAAFMADLAAGSGGPALVAGAGTGREALLLAEGGVDVVAFDPSPAMLRVAREKVAARKLEGRVRLVRADARRFAFRRRFPVVFCLNVLDHFLEDGDVAAALRNFKIHLDGGGRVALNGTAAGWHPPAEAIEETAPLPGGRNVTRRVKYKPTTRRNVYAVELWFDVRNGSQLVDRYLERAEGRSYRPDEIRGLAAGVGLTVESIFADFAGTPYRSGDAEALYILK
ncbi:MAG: class I SAM-dependent methyltransferase [Candidatus Zixiibacteriota bacterium]|jgi:SAM-dependent methyltransferase